jgi:2Fe-2S ferredoxin
MFLRKPPITIHLVEADGRRHVLQVPPTGHLMHAAVDAGIDSIAADCGGCLNCATCHVYVDEPWRQRLPAVASDEAAMLEMTAAPRTIASRLACQLMLTPALDGLVVGLPDRQY